MANGVKPHFVDMSIGRSLNTTFLDFPMASRTATLFAEMTFTGVDVAETMASMGYRGSFYYSHVLSSIYITSLCFSIFVTTPSVQLQ